MSTLSDVQLEVRMRRAIICVFLGSLLSWGANAQVAQFKCPPPGTVVTFDNATTMTWGVQLGNTCKLRSTVPGQPETERLWYAPTASTIAADHQTWAEQLKVSTLWPLSVGKKIEGRYDGPASSASVGGSSNVTSMAVSFAVERFERLNTKAGTFDTFVVSYRSEALPPSRVRLTIRQWYAVEPGVIVKIEHRTDNQAINVNTEAVSISR